MSFQNLVRMGRGLDSWTTRGGDSVSAGNARMLVMAAAAVLGVCVVVVAVAAVVAALAAAVAVVAVLDSMPETQLTVAVAAVAAVAAYFASSARAGRLPGAKASHLQPTVEHAGVVVTTHATAATVAVHEAELLGQ